MRRSNPVSASRDSQDKKKAEAGEPYTAYYRISLTGGEAVKAFTVPLKAIGIWKLDVDLYLIKARTDAGIGDFAAMSEEQREQVLKAKKDNVDYEVFDEIPFWSNGGGFTTSCGIRCMSSMRRRRPARRSPRRV